MTTAQQLLRHQFELTYATAELNLEGMTQELSLIRPDGGGNCANWVLAHLVQVQNGVMWFLEKEPVHHDPRLLRPGLPSYGPEDKGYDWSELRSAWLASRQRCLDAIAALPDEKLEESVPDPFGGTTTRAEVLNVLANHQAYHVGQLGMLRRLAGLSGAVKGPAD